MNHIIRISIPLFNQLILFFIDDFLFSKIITKSFNKKLKIKKKIKKLKIKKKNKKLKIKKKIKQT